MEPPVPAGGKPTAGRISDKTLGFVILGAIAVVLLCVCGFIVNAFGGDDGGDGTTPVGAEGPTVSASPSPEGSRSPSASPSPSPSPSKKKPPPDTDPKFGTCKEAIAAGYGPYTEGEDPEYDWYRDADGDGVVCEPPREDDGGGGDPGGDDPPDDPGTDPRFDTCGEANDAGYGPYVRGEDPEYDWYQDRDKDGVVCER